MLILFFDLNVTIVKFFILTVINFKFIACFGCEYHELRCKGSIFVNCLIF